MFLDIIHSNTGLVHLVFSVVSLITGTIVLFMQKGTKVHKKIGYVYGVNMLGVVATSFMLYGLFGGFGIFHVAAIVSFVTLLGGMLPPLFFRKNKNWISLHFSFMYWSVMGLYAAFIAESMVRIPEAPFFEMVGYATGGTMLIAGFIFGYYKKIWQKAFEG